MLLTSCCNKCLDSLAVPAESQLINITLRRSLITHPTSNLTVVLDINNNCWVKDAFLPQSTVCAKIMELLGQNKVDHRQRKVAIVSQDSFYRVLTPDQKAKALKGQYNFDHPGKATVVCPPPAPPWVLVHWCVCKLTILHFSHLPTSWYGWNLLLYAFIV